MTLAKDEMRELGFKDSYGTELTKITNQDPIEIMKDYLLLKFEQGDWHGVSDAATDIREMLAKEKK